MNFIEEFISIFGAGQLKEIKILIGELISRDTAPSSPYLLFSEEGNSVSNWLILTQSVVY